MQIDRMYFPVTTLGYGRRLGIWTIGCPRRCEGCSNPELQVTDPTRNVSVGDVIALAKRYIGEADGITITGGEPFFQPEELYGLLSGLREIGYSDILIYTGFAIEELYERGGVYSDALALAGVVIDGEYIPSLDDGKGIRGSSNQRIHILNPALAERYADADYCKRESVIVNSGGHIMTIGIPNFRKDK